jgi:hypothetical protein
MRQQRLDPAAIEAAIARLRSLGIDVLRRRWRAVFGRTPPGCLSKDLLGRMIAWRMQEQVSIKPACSNSRAAFVMVGL